MKAIICTKYGSPEVLQIRDVPKPVPGDDDVLVKIHATSVTVGDARVRAFRVPPSFWLMARLALGFFGPRKKIPGSVFSGEVESVGKNVSEFSVGDRVFGSNEHDFGAYAECITINRNGCIASMPKNFSWNEAVALIWGGMTSYHFLQKADIKPGQRVCIYGASGSLGVNAVQIARHFGAKVTGVCSTGNLELVKSLGAHDVIDYTKVDFTENAESYDVVYDTVGKTVISTTIRSLAPGGIYIHAVETPGTGILLRAGLRNTGKRLIGGTLTARKELLEKVKGLAGQGDLRPVIDRVYTLDEIVEAHRYVDLGHKKGDVVIAVQ